MYVLSYSNTLKSLLRADEKLKTLDLGLLERRSDICSFSRVHRNSRQVDITVCRDTHHSICLERSAKSQHLDTY